MAIPMEPEIMAGRRGFPDAQRLFAGVPLRRLPTRIDVGWHGTSIDPETGAFAVVRDGAGLDDLIGEVLHLIVGRKEAFVFVLGSRNVPQDISLTRRGFLALGLLSRESIAAVVEVVS